MAYQLPEDPLGIGLRQRANESRRAYDAQNRELGKAHGQLVSFSNLGPLSDPMWDAFKQAYREQGVSKMTGGSLPMSQFGESTVFDPSVQQGIDPSERFASRSMFRVR